MEQQLDLGKFAFPLVKLIERMQIFFFSNQSLVVLTDQDFTAFVVLL